MKSDQLTFVHPLEQKLAQAFDRLDIAYIYESEAEAQELDFWLPDYKIFVEVKWKMTTSDPDRVMNQLKKHANTILIQGQQSVDAFISLLMR